MNPQPQPQQPSPVSRRSFLASSAAAAGAAAVASTLVAPPVHAAGSDTLKVGLIGCGGRGTGAAQQALNADKGTVLHALGDLFEDQLERSLASLKNSHKDRVTATKATCFTGFDNYKAVIDTCDVVLLCSPPGFRPAHLAYAVEKGKHIFTEKPMATDVAGIRSVMATVEESKKKPICVVAGFCYRYSPPERETFKRIHDGAIGKLVAAHGTYNTGGLWKKERQPSWSDMEWQCRNWLYFTWLSGDHLVEQAIHTLDKTIWGFADVPPVRCVAHGGRQSRTDPAYGHIFDHFAVTYEWADGTRGFHHSRQQEGTAGDVSDLFVGTTGVARIVPFSSNVIKDHSGKTIWRYEGNRGNMYQIEHDELFAAIRAGKPINDGPRMANSTLMGIMGRIAAYTGQVIWWDRESATKAGAPKNAFVALESKESLVPEKLELGPIDVPPVAVPGKTRFA